MCKAIGVMHGFFNANSGLCACLIIVATRTPVAGAEGSTQTEPTFR